MLKIIRRVLRLSGNLSKRIWGSFICGFLESMFGLLPIAAVFLVLIELQNGQPITGQTCSIFFLSWYPSFPKGLPFYHLKTAEAVKGKVAGG